MVSFEEEWQNFEGFPILQQQDRVINSSIHMIVNLLHRVTNRVLPSSPVHYDLWRLMLKAILFPVHLNIAFASKMPVLPANRLFNVV